MYNRYTPKQDGSFNKNRVSDAPPPQSPTIGQQPSSCQAPPEHCPPPVQECCHTPNTAGGFFSKLLPKNMDTGDLLMLLILLLLLTDGSEDAPNPLLTIALFFLME